MTEERRRRGRPSMNLTEWITAAASERDKAMLDFIRQHYGDDTESAAIRRVVRLEYGRLTAGQPAQAS